MITVNHRACCHVISCYWSIDCLNIPNQPHIALAFGDGHPQGTHFVYGQLSDGPRELRENAIYLFNDLDETHPSSPTTAPSCPLGTHNDINDLETT